MALASAKGSALTQLSGRVLTAAGGIFVLEPVRQVCIALKQALLHYDSIQGNSHGKTTR